ncbi:flocculation protein FLO11 [Archocentrus centrarchus]|uniref:flocculation protein FLO11 n=1 Tax=Archocentrus centrarchus TaxID=63155 RepID=UPI0011E9E387|nr:flocculation protein FLO11-like [Archocentrus centrarchus]
MSAVERRGAPEAHWEIRPSRNQDFRRPLRPVIRPRHPVSTSTWLPDGSDRRPIYVSFVSKAILWDRGVCHYTAHGRPVPRTSLCPRFLSHMKAHSEDFSPLCYWSSKFRQQPPPPPPPPPQGKIQNTHTPTTPKTQMLLGHFHQSPIRRASVAQNFGLISGRRSAIIVPCAQLPATPSSFNPTPPHNNTPQPDSERQQSKSNPTLASPPPLPSPASQEKHPEREMVLRPVMLEPNYELNQRPAGSALSASLSSFSRGSLSDLSRPPSSLFSRSTDFTSGRSSVLCDKPPAADSMVSADPEGHVSLSSSQPSPLMQLPLAASSPAKSDLHRSSKDKTPAATTPSVPYDPLCSPTKPFSPRPISAIHLNSDKPQSSNRSTKIPQNVHLETSVAPADLNLYLDSDQGAALAFPSTTWSSCPSQQRTTPRSGSAAKLTPSTPVSWLESNVWPVLPPISPIRGRSAASRCSEISGSQSQMFDELEAIAPLSTSCLSLEQLSDSSGCPSPDTELSPGLAALTVGCDSGNLGSLSRVQLLLLDRPAPETLLSPSELEEEFSPRQDWSDLAMQFDSAGVSRPLTAGSVSERFDSAGKVQENKSDKSEGGSGSPSSWIIDPSPSFDMFRSSYSPSQSSHSSHTDEGGPDEEKSNYPGWRNQVQTPVEGRRPESLTDKESRMEERKTKVLNMLSKLQDDTPEQSKSSKGHSNFEDFDFLAKYCIFSQEKLAEYKRAFEAEDSDGDGYISCLQVLLALKNIIPPELLSEEEEIYVYRILEMVDFRVTDGLVDLRLFAVIASLAQKIASMDEFMRSLISSTDFRSLEVRLFKAKQLFLFLLEDQQADAGVQKGLISAEQLLLELKAGGIHLEQEVAVRLELQHIPPLDLLDFLAYLPLFMLIHKSVISNPLNDSSNL